MEPGLTIVKPVLHNTLLVFFMGIGCVFTLDCQILQGLVF